MSKEQLVKRLLCSEARIDAQRVNTGYLTKEDWHRLSQVSGDLSEAKIFIDDTASITIPELRSKSRRLSLEHGLDLLIVDYLQLMSGSTQRYENRTQEISQISRGLKGIAKELNLRSSPFPSSAGRWNPAWRESSSTAFRPSGIRFD